MQEIHHDSALYPMFLTCIYSCAMVTNMGQTPTVRGCLHLKSAVKQGRQNLCTECWIHIYTLTVYFCCTDKLSPTALSLLRHHPSDVVIS